MLWNTKAGNIKSKEIRREGEDEVTCVFNFSDGEKNVSIENDIAPARKNIFLNIDISKGMDGVLRLKPWSVAVFTS